MSNGEFQNSIFTGHMKTVNLVDNSIVMCLCMGGACDIWEVNV